MSNPVATVGLRFDSTDIQEAGFGIFLEIVRGLQEPPAVRGVDYIVPSSSGRSVRNRVADVLPIELRGYVSGVDADAFRTNADAVRALFDPTAEPADLVATLETGELRTIVARAVNAIWDQITPDLAAVSIELESVGAESITIVGGAAAPGGGGWFESTPTGEEAAPGVGTIAALIALGETNIVLREGVYQDSFGSTPRSDTITISAYPGETPIIEPNGDDNFVYVGTGHWTIGALLFRGFRAVASGIFGCEDGQLDFNGTEVEGDGGATDSLSQIAYYYGDGGGTLNGVNFHDAPGAALQLYAAGAASPSVAVLNSHLHGQYIGAFAYDGALDLEDTTVLGDGSYDIEKQSDASLSQTNVQGGGPAGAVRVDNV
jgi:hypothetical protein